MSDNKYEKPTVSVEKQLRRSLMTVEQKRIRRSLLRLRNGQKRS